jgi:hypothetical protein
VSRRCAPLAVAAAATALGAGACGGAEVRAGDYRSQAAALCEQAAAARGDAVAVEQRRRRLLDLVPPPELVARHEELREIDGIIERVGSNAARGDVSPARALERIRRVSERRARTYRAMGIPGCAR